MDALSRHQELIASNLANLQSTGFRRSVLSFSERLDSDKAPLLGTRVESESLDFSQGFLQQTGRKLDVAISGDGFFALGGEDGTVYSRAGVFFRQPNGALVNGDNMPVLDDAGAPINIDPLIPESSLHIDSEGFITAGQQTVAQLGIVGFANNKELIPKGQVYFMAPDGVASGPPTGRVMQGERELSNSSPVTELINLIVTNRMFEAAQRSVRTIAESVQQHYRS